MIETYQKIKAKEVNKEDGLAKLSKDLRQIAINRGIGIDDIYRNISGMNWQFGIIDRVFTGRYDYDRKPSALFTEMVALYTNNREQYYVILEEAKRMVEPHTDAIENRKERFIAWLKTNEGKKVSEQAVVDCYEAAFEYAQKRGVAKTSIWEIADVKLYNSIRAKLSANRLFRFTHRSVFSAFEKMGKYYAVFLKEEERITVEEPKTQGKTESKIGVQPDIDIKVEIVEQEQTMESEVETNVEAGSQPDETGIRRHKIPDNRITLQFKEWLEKDQGMALASARGYSSAIKTINEWANNRGIWSESIFDVSVEDAKKQIAILLKNATFSNYNVERHNQFSAALTKFLCFLDVIVVEKSSDKSIDEQLHTSISEILKEKYPYGYRFDSIREAMRFRKFAEERGVVLPDSDEELKSLIIAAGDIIENKVYARNDDLQEELRGVVKCLCQEGIKVIYYEAFLSNQKALTDKFHIYTEEMLKEYLQKSISGFSFAKRFMCIGNKNTETDAVSEEMNRVWGEESTCAISNLIKRLPYIPETNIQRILYANPKYVWVTDGVYLLLERFIISESEKKQIIEYVTQKCAEQGFASLPDIPLGHIEIENFNLSSFAIQTAIYRTVLSGQYKLNGKILTKNSSSDLDIVAIIKREYAECDNCSLEEVANRVEEILGTSNRQGAFRALYDDYVRADKDRFVANHYVGFMVDEIDKVLSTIFINKFGAIKQVTTFAMFPICGLPWNHFVLESYCYKYSKKYSLHVINFNSKNAGIIAEKTYNKNYDDMLAIVIAKANVDLRKEFVIPYLCENGFLAKNSYGRIDELIKKAKSIREG